MKKLFLFVLVINCYNGHYYSQGETCATAESISEGQHTADGPSSGNGTLSGNDHSDWYSYTASEDGYVTVSSCGDSSDTYLTIYTGSCSALDFLEESDDFCDYQSEISFFVSSGNTYFIEWNDSYDTLSFNWSLSFDPSSIEDVIGGETCNSATQITTGIFSSDGATSGNGSVGEGTNSDWYIYIADKDGVINISSCIGRTSDTRLFVYDGSCSNLNLLQDVDDNCGESQEEAILNVTAGKSYFIEWTDIYDNSSFLFELEFTEALYLIGGETCEDAVSLTSGRYISDGPNSGAGASDQPTALDADWYKYQATETGELEISSCGTLTPEADTYLTVYEGDNCLNLDSLNSNDDFCGIQSQVTLDVEAGKTYYFEWDNRFDVSPFEFFVTFNSTLSVIDLNLNQVNIYPNPSNGVFNLDLKKPSEISSIKVTNTNGQIILEYQEAVRKIDLQEMNKGLYFITITYYNKEAITKRLIKE